MLVAQLSLFYQENTYFGAENVSCLTSIVLPREYLLLSQLGSQVVEHSLSVWEARVRFPTESNQRFKIGS